MSTPYDPGPSVGGILQDPRPGEVQEILLLRREDLVALARHWAETLLAIEQQWGGRQPTDGPSLREWNRAQWRLNDVRRLVGDEAMRPVDRLLAVRRTPGAASNN